MFANPKTKGRLEIKQETTLTKTHFLERPPEVVLQVGAIHLCLEYFKNQEKKELVC